MSSSQHPTRISRRNTSQQHKNGDQESIKYAVFHQSSSHLADGENMSATLIHFLQFIECLYFLWYAVHPILKIYRQDAFLLPQFLIVLKSLNFHEFLRDNPDSYPVILFAVMGFNILHLLTAIISMKRLQQKQKSSVLHYIRLTANYLYVINMKVLLGPTIGLFINILYCNSSSPYHQGQECYSTSYLPYCVVATAQFILLIGGIVSFIFLFTVRNPFSSSPLAYPNRNFLISKSIFKILFPLYFALQPFLEIEFLYILAAPALWGAYIFFHRLSSLHSFDPRHFYIEFFMEGFLFWMFTSALISYYLDGTPNPQSMSFVYSLITSLFIAFLLVSIQKKIQCNFMQENFTGKIKKQNIEKFILGLLSQMIHTPLQESKKNFKVFSKILCRSLPQLNICWKMRLKSIKSFTVLSIKSPEEVMTKQIYEFLLSLTNRYLEQTNSFTLKLLKCQLLKLLHFDYYSLHQALDLRQKKLNLIDQYSLFGFLNGYHHLNDSLTKGSSDLVKMYHYQTHSNIFEQLMEECAENNGDYWQELGQSTPSIPKLRNLASHYITFYTEISNLYLKIKQILPESIIPTLNYLHFLLQVGVDTRETVKTREELRSKLEVHGQQKGVLGGLLADDVCTIVIDTIGSKMGEIVNCNSQTKKLVGFQKNTLLGKNVTRIMPKIYSEIHNNFIIKFIRNAKDIADEYLHDKMPQSKRLPLRSQKVVTALNCDNYLVEVGISLQMIVSANNDLNIAGFLRSKTDHGDGLIMVNSDSGQILGINKIFASLMKNKVLGKQVVQEQTKFSTFFPQVNISALELSEAQTTLEITLDDQSSKNESVKVVLMLKNQMTHEDYKLFFISISKKKEIKTKELINLNRRKSSNNSINFNHLELENLIKNQQLQKSRNQSSRLLESINNNLTEVTSCMQTHGGEDLAKDVPLTRKLSEFIEERQRTHFGKCIKIFWLIFVTFTTGFLIANYLFRDTYLNKVETMYDQMEMIADIPYQQAQINLYSNRIWCILSKQFQQPTYTRYFSGLQTVTQKLASSFTQIVSDLGKIQYPLQYNENKTYSFAIQKVVNETYVSDQITMKSLEGITSYISSARMMYDTQLMSTSNIPNKFFIQEYAYFITKNGDKCLPEIAISAVNAFEDYFKYNRDHEKVLIVILKTSLFFTGLLMIAGVVLFGKAIGKTHREIMKLYDTLRLWDVSEMAIKCDEFLSKRGKVLKKKRSSSILKIFPIKTFVDLTKPKSGTHKSLNTANKPLKDVMIQQKQKLAQREQQGQNSQGQELLQSTNDSNVKISLGNPTKTMACIICFTIIATILASAILGYSVYSQFSTMERLETQFQLVKNVGLVRKTLTYLDLFAFRIATWNPDYSYAQLIKETAKNFYEYSSLTYTQLGDAVFKTVYGQVENLEVYFAQDPGTRDKSLLLDIYFATSESFTQACTKIVSLIQTVFKPNMNAIIASEKLREVIITISLWVLCLTLFLVMHYGYLKPLHIQRTQAINMLKILPAWMVRRSTEAYRHIAK